jgi:hypothetical protein
VQENYLVARELDANSEETQKLSEFYYSVRAGIGFNKTPQNYGAFPTDPYSHTPKQAGAQQPGMTGQVKEEVITRFVELGIEVQQATVRINPSLLKPSEFLKEAAQFDCQNVLGEACSYRIEKDQLAFTYCQVPFIYCKSDKASIDCYFSDGSIQSFDGLELSKKVSQHLFTRDNNVIKIQVHLPNNRLLN